VPRGTPAKDLSRRPPPGVGPYRLFRSSTRTELLRTRDFELPGVPPGHADRITLVRPSPPARQVQAVITGSLDVMQEPTSVNLLPEIPSRYRDRYRQDPTATAVALVPDTESPPLDAVSVRRAIAESLDAETLTRLYQGLVKPSCNLLPEAIPGFRRLDPCPYGDRDEPPDLPAAAEQIETVAADGAPITVTADAGVPPAVVRQVIRTLRSIGLAAGARPGGAGIRLERFAPILGHPAAYLEPVAGTVLDDELATGIAEATLAPAGEEADDAWADADRRVVEQAYVAPVGTELRPAFLSERLDIENCFRYQPLFGLDLSSLCLR
jgi:Bacterial extracellular solute-binding proteins, family 5 Middle